MYPKEGSMLVIASPKKNVSELEAKKIVKYLESGGNLLWLLDDSQFKGLKEVADYIGLQVAPGKIHDASATQYGSTPDLTFALRYGDHPITRNFMLRTLFSNPKALNAVGTYENGWEVTELIDVAAGGWLENGNEKEPTFEANEDQEGTY